MGLSHATGLGRLQAGGLDGEDPTSWSAIERSATTHAKTPWAECRALPLPPVLAGCRWGDLPRSHALATGTDAGAGPTVVDGEGLCLQQRINIQVGAYALISRPPFFLF